MWRSLLRLRRALSVDHDFFAPAARTGGWREEVAWLYGWMVSDGCVVHPTRGLERGWKPQPVINLSVKRTDRDVLEKMKRWTQSQHMISEYRNYSLSGYVTIMSRLRFSSSSMAADLAVLGVVPRKTSITYLYEGLLLPMNRTAVRHAIRGILEGEGCISYEPKRRYWRVYFSGTRELLASVQVVINEQMVLSGVSSARGSLSLKAGTTWQLGYTGGRAARAICEWIYTDVNPECVLDRKAALARLAITGTPPVTSSSSDLWRNDI